MPRLPIKFNTEPQGKITVSGIRVVYEVRKDGYYYFVDFEKLVEIVESQQNIINELEKKLKQEREKPEKGKDQESKKTGIPTARNSEEWG